MKRRVGIIVIFIALTSIIFSNNEEVDYLDMTISGLSLGTGLFGLACGMDLQSRLNGDIETINNYDEMNLSYDNHKLIHASSEALSLSLNIVHGVNVFNNYFEDDSHSLSDNLRIGAVAGSVLTSLTGGLMGYLGNNDLMYALGITTFVLQLLDFTLNYISF